MHPTERQALTRALSAVVQEMAADIQVKLLRPGRARRRAEALHADEGVGDDFAVWTDLLSRRAAVLWVLKSVYVRVLEDRGLLNPVRILDPESQHLFAHLAPNLGDTAYLRWVYRDLATTASGLAELFAPQPAEIVLPSDALSRKLIELWRHTNADSGELTYSFAHERFDGRLMGDLYQDLDPVVKERFALLQTPDFVLDFILDETLTPAIDRFGVEVVRVIDPACGSGHFLLGAFRRLVDGLVQERGLERPGAAEVRHVLGRVVGIDLNDYACALARARLVMAAVEMLSDPPDLTLARDLHPKVFWADGLDQVERDPEPVQTDLFVEVQESAVVAAMTRPEVRARLRPEMVAGFHAVVANPPYITEKDTAKKAYHKEKVGRGRRYVSAHRQYQLVSPFTERAFQIAVDDGCVGLIVGNGFMKREFGKPLIEKVLATQRLTKVVDTSQAFIPGHGTPTVLLFAERGTPGPEPVYAIMGKRGEPGTPEDPAQGRVWTSILAGNRDAEHEDEFVSVSLLPRERLAGHPWSLRGGGAAELKARLEAAGASVLSSRTEAIGRTTVCGEDPVFIMSTDAAARLAAGDLAMPLTIGEVVRDWSIAPGDIALYPYETLGGPPIAEEHPAIRRHLWFFRTTLGARSVFGKTLRERGQAWYEHLEHYSDRFRTPLSIAFAFVATHNHFVLDRGGKVFNRSAPVIKLPEGATEDDHLALLGLLNSSTACFWMKQVFQAKSNASQRHHPDPVRVAYEFAATGLQEFPIPSMSSLGDRLVAIGKRLALLAADRSSVLSAESLAAVLASNDCTAPDISRWQHERWLSSDQLREQMVALQEECDWLVYHAFGLTDLQPRHEAALGAFSCPRGSRPFEQLRGRHTSIRAGGEDLDVEDAEAPPVGELAHLLVDSYARRRAEIQANRSLRVIESPIYKRQWRDTEQNIAEPRFRAETNAGQLNDWLLDRLETWTATRHRPFTPHDAARALLDDKPLLAVLEVLTGRRDFDLTDELAQRLRAQSVPNAKHHRYKPSGLKKRAAWEHTWALQHREDAGEAVTPPVPPKYGSGDFLRAEYYKLRGKLDVPKERFIHFSELTPSERADGTAPAEDARYGWAGWTPRERAKALLELDEELADEGGPVADRYGLLHGAWALLPYVAWESPEAAEELRSVITMEVGQQGVTDEMLAEWAERHPMRRRGRGRR